MDYYDLEWFALERNRDHSVILEIASKSCILDFSVDSDGCTISSKEFLPTVVNIMVILFTLAISYLTTSNLPQFMDLTFQVPM